MISEFDLQQIMPRLPADKRQLYLPFLTRVMRDFEIDTPLRAAAFLAQLAHESGELRFMEEIWGPTAQQKRYEPPSDLARRLGNTQPGDGKRYKGRGPIQITGRSNYRRYGEMLGVDLEGNPDLAATPQTAFEIAGVYWQSNGLNELADVQDFIGITRRINGGLNGLADRQRYYETAKRVLGITGGTRSRSVATTAVRSNALRSALVPEAPAADESAPLPPPKLPRGQEALFEDADSSSPRPDAESKKKSAGNAPRMAQKPAGSKAVKKAAKKAAKKPAAKKAVTKAAKKPAAKKAVKKAAKKPAAKKAVKKAAKKPAKKATRR